MKRLSVTDQGGKRRSRKAARRVSMHNLLVLGRLSVQYSTLIRCVGKLNVLRRRENEPTAIVGVVMSASLDHPRVGQWQRSNPANHTYLTLTGPAAKRMSPGSRSGRVHLKSNYQCIVG